MTTKYTRPSPRPWHLDPPQFSSHTPFRDLILNILYVSFTVQFAHCTHCTSVCAPFITTVITPCYFYKWLALTYSRPCSIHPSCIFQNILSVLYYSCCCAPCTPLLHIQNLVFPFCGVRGEINDLGKYSVFWGVVSILSFSL
jgi:hypothetical protein